MTFKLHRVAVNLYNWQRPSPGRLGSDNVGEYVQTNGFGFEDWNFNTGLAEDGYVWGYTRAQPGKSFRGSPISLVLATWDPKDRWKAVGFYRNAEFIDTGPNRISEHLLRQRA